jgi:hypothetical protein
VARPDLSIFLMNVYWSNALFLKYEMEVDELSWEYFWIRKYNPDSISTYLSNINGRLDYLAKQFYGDD